MISYFLGCMKAFTSKKRDLIHYIAEVEGLLNMHHVHM